MNLVHYMPYYTPIIIIKSTIRARCRDIAMDEYNLYHNLSTIGTVHYIMFP